MQTSNKTISLELLVQNSENPRLEKATGSHLLANILSEGLLTRLVVMPVDGGLYRILQGNNRHGALCTIAEHHKDRFSELFPRGVPCSVITDTTAMDIAQIVNDHGLVSPLHSIFELGMSTRIFMKAKPSISCGELTDKLAHSIDLLFPIRQGETIERLRVAREKGEYSKELHLVRRGVVQLLQAIAMGPACIESFYKSLALGESPSMPLTREQIANLVKSQNADFAMRDESGLCPYTRTSYGPNVLETIDLVKTKLGLKAQGAMERGEAIKPISKTTLEQCLKVAESRQVKLLLSIVLGLLPISQLSDLDKSLAEMTRMD